MGSQLSVPWGILQSIPSAEHLGRLLPGFWKRESITGWENGWWPWILFHIRNGEGFSRAVGPLTMGEDQGEWIGYSISLEMNLYVSILSMVQSFANINGREERYFKGANFFFLEPPSFCIMDSKTSPDWQSFQWGGARVISKYWSIFLNSFCWFLFYCPLDKGAPNVSFSIVLNFALWFLPALPPRLPYPYLLGDLNFHWHGKTMFLVFFSFNGLIMMCLGMNIFKFIPQGIHSASSMFWLSI